MRKLWLLKLPSEDMPTNDLFLGGPEVIDPAGVPLPQPAQSWVWLVDLERTIALLIGRAVSWRRASGFPCVSRGTGYCLLDETTTFQ